MRALGIVVNVFFSLVLITACREPRPVESEAGPASRPRTAVRSADEPRTERVWSSIAEIPAHRTVLAVTHPTKRVMESYALLLDRDLLDAPGLLVMGLHNASEKTSYRSSRKLVSERKTNDMALLAIDCVVEKDDVFDDNRCSGIFAELFEAVDGVIFSGGPDIPPELYGEKTSLLTRVRSRERLYWEISLASHLLGGPDHTRPALLSKDPAFFALGICLGMQVLNTAGGGTLVQDIPSELHGLSTWQQVAEEPEKSHRNPEYYTDPHSSVWPGVFHPLKRTGAKELWTEMAPEGAKVQVMSIHHQCVEKTAPSFEVIATSGDGKVPEAMRHETYPHVLGVQFHPEYAVLWDDQGTYRRFRSDDAENYFYEKLRQNPTWLSFHVNFWKVMSSRLEASTRSQGE